MIVVFVGPTIAAPDVQRRLPDAVVLPPAAQGDVFRACAAGARVIGLIDGYFESVPAVWHKEILWAMSQGVFVYGAASMGALRAAELSRFGMIGVGTVFERFQSGAYERDDEVTIIHGDAASGYRAGSTALVDMRATLEAAMSNGILHAPEAAQLLNVARRLFYADRTWPAVTGAVRQSWPAERIDVFSRWLPEGEVRQKRLDALALCERIDADRERFREPFKIDYHFEYTEFFRIACEQDGRWGDSPGLHLNEAVLDELRLRGEAPYSQALQSADQRTAAIHRARQSGFEAGPEQVEATWAALIAEQGLDTVDKRRAWCAARDLEGEEFLRFLRDEAAVRFARQRRPAGAARALLDNLRLEGGYAALRERARRKRGLAEPSGADDPDARELLAWHHERRNEPIPTNLAEYAGRLDLPHEEVWLRVLRREYLFEQAQPASSERIERALEKGPCRPTKAGSDNSGATS